MYTTASPSLIQHRLNKLQVCDTCRLAILWSVSQTFGVVPNVEPRWYPELGIRIRWPSCLRVLADIRV